MRSVKVGFVIPTKNAQNGLESLLPNLRAQFPKCEILIMDGGSKDATVPLAQKNGCLLPYRLWSHKYGPSLVNGIVGAHFWRECDLVFQMDADHDPTNLKDFIELTKSYDLVVGNQKRMSGRFRRWSSRFACWLVRNILWLKDVDHPTCGLRLWTRGALERMPWRKVKSKGFGVQIETLLYASFEGLRIGECMFEGHKQSEKLSILRIIEWLRTFFRLIRVRLWALVKYPFLKEWKI